MRLKSGGTRGGWRGTHVYRVGVVSARLTRFIARGRGWSSRPAEYCIACGGWRDD
jgi:hypothetical protein